MLRKLLSYFLRPFRIKIMLHELGKKADLLQRNTLYIDKPKVWADLDKNGQHEVVNLLTVCGKTMKGYVVVRSGKTVFMVKKTPEAYCRVGAIF